MTTAYRIVVGVDGSPASIVALRWAFRQAYARGGAVQAVCVWTGDPRATETDAWRGQGEAILSDAITAALANNSRVTISGVTIAGRPADELVRLADGADLLVLGSHGRGRLSRAVLGSVAERCVRMATSPVVVIPPYLVQPAEAAETVTLHEVQLNPSAG
ncbi:universal stress protein [Hamadaea sp. NPDC050747]|uniref:universal stress protein n=1 Tax=Hamadaea sp. NPDC050747 TaxID=3155789 RepID=UPI00340C61F5